MILSNQIINMSYVVKDIIIYPIKGIAGNYVQSATMESEGFVYDRRMMLIDTTNTFVSQRTVPEMSQLKATIVDDSTILINYKDQQLIIQPSEVFEGIECTVWDHTVVCHLFSKAVNEWFSDMLRSPMRLVHKVDAHARTKTIDRIYHTTDVSLADGYPYLIAGTASVDLIAKKTGITINPLRFRPNIIIKTSVPHMEDELDILTSNNGGGKLQVIKPCARCPVVDIEPETGVSTKVVLKTLASYRRVGNAVNYGANAICLQNGVLSVGDALLSP